jgi:hypothetical protein
MSFQKPRQAGRVPCFFLIPILGKILISRRARKAGPSQSERSDVISQSRGSSLVKGFENAAQLGLPKHCSASLMHPCISESSVV